MDVIARSLVVVGALAGVGMTGLERLALAVSDRLGRWAMDRYTARLTAEFETAAWGGDGG